MDGYHPWPREMVGRAWRFDDMWPAHWGERYICGNAKRRLLAQRADPLHKIAAIAEFEEEY